MSEQRTSRCNYRHAQTKVVDGVTYGGNNNTRQFLWGNYPLEAPSSPDLPFFKSCPDKPHDEHYCGCMGWD